MSHKLFEGKLSPTETLQLKHDGLVVRKDGNIVMTASYLEKCGKWDGVEKGLLQPLQTELPQTD